MIDSGRDIGGRDLAKKVQRQNTGLVTDPPSAPQSPAPAGRSQNLQGMDDKNCMRIYR